MRLSRNYAILFILIFAMFSLSGCATLGSGVGAILGGTFKLLGTVLSIAKKVPWWMWL